MNGLAGDQWQPGIVLSALSNRAHSLTKEPVGPSQPLDRKATDVGRLVIIHVYRTLLLVGAPCAKAFTVAVWAFAALAALASQLKRSLLAFLGWQNQRISKQRTVFGLVLLPDLRNWHITLGTSCISPQQQPCVVMVHSRLDNAYTMIYLFTDECVSVQACCCWVGCCIEPPGSYLHCATMRPGAHEVYSAAWTRLRHFKNGNYLPVSSTPYSTALASQGDEQTGARRSMMRHCLQPRSLNSKG